MLYRLEKKFGRFAIKNLMVYVTAMYVIGWLISVLSPGFYINWLSLDVNKVLKGEVWRLVTFLIQPVEASSGGGMGMLFMLISLYLYYFIGRTLEGLWGSFRFNLFYFSGIFFNIIAVFITYFATLSIYGYGVSIWVTLDYINLSLFLAFAVEFSEVSLLLFFILPVKVKYIGIVYAAFHIFSILELLFSGEALGVYEAIALTVAMLNFIIFFFSTRKLKKGSVKQAKRRFTYVTEVRRGEREAKQTSVNAEGRSVVSRHRCMVCGRTELDDPELEFRFCSKCEGEFEYCMDHLYTHVHVVREKVDTNNTKDE
ncbi:MAG: rhomboid family intramembrane serine protease [Lachnospiraceae bacterium]|nr:rhomboid family intramembrane serine protease [Lachnospiraceae bacterium]